MAKTATRPRAWFVLRWHCVGAPFSCSMGDVKIGGDDGDVTLNLRLFKLSIGFLEAARVNRFDPAADVM